MRNKMRIKPGIALKRGSGNISRIEPNFTAFARVTFASDTGHCQDEGFFANSGLALWPNIQQKTFAVAIPQRRARRRKGSLARQSLGSIPVDRRPAVRTE